MSGYIEVFGHGGDVETAASRFGGNAADFLDYSANINPLGPPKEVLEALRQSLHSVLRYPDPGHRGFKALLGERLEVTPEQISVGNGAAESMALILLALAPRKVGTVEPGFSEYRALARQFGAELLYTEGLEELNWQAPPENIEQLMEKVDLLFLGQPNNPNGVQYPVETLHRLARKAEEADTVLVIDEAFIDFIPADRRQSLAPDLNTYPHVIIIRSMTKFYAIPGLRLGYAMGSARYIQAMTEKQVTWSVNGLALIAGEACLRSGERFERDTISQITFERERLMKALEAHGCRVTPGDANFILARVPEPWTAASLQEALGRRGILIRSCAMYPGLDAGHVRFAVKGAEANDRLLDVLGGVLKRNGGPGMDQAIVDQVSPQGHAQNSEHRQGRGADVTLPFYNYFTHGKRDENTYVSSSWPGLHISAHGRHIKAQVTHPALALSSAVYGGGMLELNRVFNIYVDKHYRCDDPPRDIAEALNDWQEHADHCAGLLTAVRLEHTSIQEYTSSAFGLLCCTTAGVSNAARAGSERTVFDVYGNKQNRTPYIPGTINIMLWFNGQMTPGAMVNAVQTAVEAKAAALADAGIADSENGLSATGTTTDAIVLVVRQTAADDSHPIHSYAGTATVLGSAIGRLVYDTVTESLQAGLQWKERNGHSHDI